MNKFYRQKKKSSYLKTAFKIFYTLNFKSAIYRIWYSYLFPKFLHKNYQIETEEASNEFILIFLICTLDYISQFIQMKFIRLMLLNEFMGEKHIKSG